ncbi:hypothetical protein R50073_33430 [Maricurvus nonylphenolicus]|uniref:response regulator n=1 Tax=Maricurvus nonylphenolicus TaxID=1008307 RepID=UPI0036F2FCE8
MTTENDPLFLAESKTILVVDDSEDSVSILLELLSDYDLLVALDGESALEMLIEEQVDLVLLDIQMPGIDGYETCRRLKSQPDIADIPVVFITAETTAEAIDKAYEMGAVDYISKPFKPREVRVRVHNHLSLQVLTRQLRG